MTGMHSMKRASDAEGTNRQSTSALLNILKGICFNTLPVTCFTIVILKHHRERHKSEILVEYTLENTTHLHFVKISSSHNVPLITEPRWKNRFFHTHPPPQSMEILRQSQHFIKTTFCLYNFIILFLLGTCTRSCEPVSWCRLGNVHI